MATTYYVDAATGSDSNAGTSTGAAFLTIAHALSVVVAGDTVYIKAGTYVQTATLNITVATLSIIGYGVTPGDNGTAPLITTATSSINLFATNNAAATVGTFAWVNLSLSNTASTRGVGVQALSDHQNKTLWVFNRDTFDGFSNAINADNAGSHWTVGNVAILQTEIKNSVSHGVNLFGQSSTLATLTIDGSYIHNNGGRGLWVQAAASNTPAIGITRSIFAGNTAVGVLIDGGVAVISNSDFIGNTGDGAAINGYNTSYTPMLSNCIFYGNGGWGLNYTESSPVSSYLAGHNNAFGANTSGAATGWTLSGSDVTLTANPFVNSASGNFALNSTAGGGVLLKGIGYPGIFPGGLSTGSLDIGAVQTGGGGGGGGGSFVFLA